LFQCAAKPWFKTWVERLRQPDPTVVVSVSEKVYRKPWWGANEQRTFWIAGALACEFPPFWDKRPTRRRSRLVILSAGGATEGSDAESKDPEDLSRDHAAAGSSPETLCFDFQFWQSWHFRRFWQSFQAVVWLIANG